MLITDSKQHFQFIRKRDYESYRELNFDNKIVLSIICMKHFLYFNF